MTKLDIVNSALDLLGQSNISNLNSPGGHAPKLKRMLETVTKRIQHMAKWSELKKSVTLNRDESYTDGLRFPVPSDFLLMVDPGTSSDYEVKAGYVYVDYTGNPLSLSELPIEYTGLQLDPTNWSDYMTEAISYALAAEACMPVAKDSKVLAFIKGESYMATRRALNRDSQNHTPKTRPAGNWINSRGSRVRV